MRIELVVGEIDVGDGRPDPERGKNEPRPPAEVDRGPLGHHRDNCYRQPLEDGHLRKCRFPPCGFVGRPASRGRGPSRGRSGRAPGRASTNRRDQAGPWARRTPSGRDGCRPRSPSPRTGATPSRAPSSPPAGGAGSAQQTSSTRQKSSASPTRRWLGSRRPRRIPTPPTRPITSP